MNSKRFFFVLLGAVGILGLLGVGGVYMGNSMLVKHSAKLKELKLNDQVLREQQVALIQANKDLIKYEGLENIAQSVVPQDKDEAKTVREIIKIADETGIKIASVTFPTSTLGQAAAKKPAASADAAKTTEAEAAAVPTVTQVEPVVGISGVYAMNITVTSDESETVLYADMINFLAKLEQNRRTAHVKNITVTPDEKDRSRVSFSIILDVYIKP